ncbi:MAG: UDP-N-acetylmuramoyl-tripeptide--D-alanyl-D-alanine ligase [Ignavibacteriae bacterium]|nr:UDP-N-acetylmuramoyl-tripeptide--D-alanyl-D-alanine ligase [Ignavibacteriota bacterium]
MKDVLSMEYLDVQNVSSVRTRTFRDVSIDSRTIGAGDLFIAIRGEKLDGHAFVKRAFETGAACAVVDERADRASYQDRPHVVVRDTTKALGQLARAHRRKFSIPIVAIAGSNGKTTTKEMIAEVLSTKYSVLRTQGNLNNHIGVPMTLFRLTKRHEIAVVEVGTNHFGEIMNLCQILEPTHGLITNIGREHLEFFNDLEGVAQAEGELFQALGKTGIGFVNADDTRVAPQSKSLRKKATYGFFSNAKVRGILKTPGTDGCAMFSVKARNKKSFDVQLRMPGKYAMSNALAAVAVGLAFDVPAKSIQQSLKRFRPIGKRMEIVKLGGITILNDTYNANSDSTLSALETLHDMQCPGSKIVILADMLELGDAAQAEHERIGYAVKEMGFNTLLTYGPMAQHINAAAKGIELNLHYDQKNALAEYAAELVAPGDIVLIKGSRGMTMEDVVTFLQERIGNRAE